MLEHIDAMLIRKLRTRDEGRASCGQGCRAVNTVEMERTQADLPGADQHPSDPHTNRCQNCEKGREKELRWSSRIEPCVRSAWCDKHKRKAPPDMLTCRSVQACLSPVEHCIATNWNDAKLRDCPSQWCGNRRGFSYYGNCESECTAFDTVEARQLPESFTRCYQDVNFLPSCQQAQSIGSQCRPSQTNPLAKGTPYFSDLTVTRDPA